MNDQNPTCICGCGTAVALGKRFAQGHNRRGSGIDHIGGKYGRLTVTAEALRAHGVRRLTCRCDCGNEVVVLASNLTTGHTQSCGCIQREITIERSYKHGHASRGATSRTYNTWCSMIERCTNPNATQWRWYGGRDITVCARWIGSFEAFIADMGERPDGRTLDRINPNGNYEPGNCRWATMQEQIENRRPRS